MLLRVSVVAPSVGQGDGIRRTRRAQGLIAKKEGIGRQQQVVNCRPAPSLSKGTGTRRTGMRGTAQEESRHQLVCRPLLSLQVGYEPARQLVTWVLMSIMTGTALFKDQLQVFP